MEDPINIPAQTRLVNGWYFSRALQDNPETKILGVMGLVSSLQSTMKTAGIHEYDQLLYRNVIGSRRAWYELTGERNPGHATQTAEQVLLEIMFLVLDTRFVKGDFDKFSLGGK
jgi:hypothetical protein